MSGLAVDKLRVRFGDIEALASVSFTVAPGQVLSINGPNGAGKTTILDVLSGFLRPTSGEVAWMGRSLIPMSAPERASRGVVRSFQEVRLAWSLTVTDTLRLAHSARNQGGLAGALFRPFTSIRTDAASLEKVKAFLREHPLESKSEKRAEELSFGQQKVLAVSCAFLTGASLVLLDEPTSGVSGDDRQWILQRIASERQLGTAVILVEHDLEAADEVADLGLLVEEGSVKAFDVWFRVREWMESRPEATI